MRTPWLRILALASICIFCCAASSGSGDPVILGSQQFTRGFDTREVGHQFALLSSRDLRYFSTGSLEVTLSSSITGSGLGRNPRTALIDGYVALDLPPEVVAAGPMRLYYVHPTGNERLMYSGPYPALPRYAALQHPSSRDAQPEAWLDFLDQAATVLDARATVSATAEPLRSIPTGQIAFWVIPADFRSEPLVNLFAEQSTPQPPQIIARLPVRIVGNPSGSKVKVHAGALSCAAAVVEVTPDLAPPGSLRLDELSGALPGTEEADPAAKVPLLVYSCQWLSWDEACPVLATSAPAPAGSAQPAEMKGVPSPAVELVTPAGPAPEQNEKPARLRPVAPDTQAKSEARELTNPKPSKAEQPDSGAGKVQPTPSKDLSPGPPRTTARQVEVGTLPAPVEEFEVQLKPITGSAGQRGFSDPPPAQPYDPAQPSTPGYEGSAPGMVRYYGPGGPANLHPTPQLQPMPAPPGLGTMALVPAGRFLMGTEAGTPYGDADELPQHEVDLAAFYIDRYPVTNRQFGEFVMRSGYTAEGEWQRYSTPAHLDMPVRNVSWNDASAYAAWAGKRLPTEAEWEKAARGTDGRLFPWGNDWNSSILPRGEFGYELVTAPKAASPYGVMALVGVLWQWTATPWHEYPYDPAARGEKKILRGGAFSNGRNVVRCANRYFEMPGTALNTFTFRCVKDAP